MLFSFLEIYRNTKLYFYIRISYSCKSIYTNRIYKSNESYLIKLVSHLEICNTFNIKDTSIFYESVLKTSLVLKSDYLMFHIFQIMTSSERCLCAFTRDGLFSLQSELSTK